jgi:hypothetical protein
MGLKTTALITVQECRDLLEQVGTTKDMLLTHLVNAASRRLERYCRGPLIIQPFVERHSVGTPTSYGATGVKRLWLRHYPVVSVTSIVDGFGNSVPAADYHLSLVDGALTHFSTWPTPYDANKLIGEWVVTHSAGFWVKTEDVDSDAKLACSLLIGDYLARKAGSISSSSFGGLSLGFSDEMGLPAMTQSLMAPYKRNRI